MNRRRFLKSMAGMAAVAALPSLAYADENPPTPTLTTTPSLLTLSIDPSTRLPTLPVDFTGLSYESAQLGNPDFFSPKNKNLIGFVRSLGAKGVLRIGGNTSEYTDWSPSGGAPADSPLIASPDTGGKIHRRTTITPVALTNLSGFLEAIGWKLIYGLNLGTCAPNKAADEAAAVAQAIGPALLAFQIGNEPDLFHDNGIRPSTYGFPDYFQEWTQFAGAVHQRVPQAKFAGPDVAGSINWITSFAELARNEVIFLSGHYYAEGPPSNPAMNIDRLLHSDSRLRKSTEPILKASHLAGVPYRITECNSCYKGGKAGVSDTFASALWGGDYMLRMAQADFSGVNFHGGGNGHYTPIAGSGDAGYSARPLYYGMLLAGQFSGATLLGNQFDTQGLSVTAYVASSGSRLLVALFNKDEQQPVRVNVKSPARGASLWRLEAPAVDSVDGVTLAGAQVAPDGSWKPQKEESVRSSAGQLPIDLPPAGAVLAFLN